MMNKPATGVNLKIPKNDTSREVFLMGKEKSLPLYSY